MVVVVSVSPPLSIYSRPACEPINPSIHSHLPPLSRTHFSPPHLRRNKVVVCTSFHPSLAFSPPLSSQPRHVIAKEIMPLICVERALNTEHSQNGWKKKSSRVPRTIQKIAMVPSFPTPAGAFVLLCSPCWVDRHQRRHYSPVSPSMHVHSVYTNVRQSTHSMKQGMSMPRAA